MNRSHLQLVTTTAPAVEPPWEGDLDGASFQALSRATGREYKHIALDHVVQVAAATAIDVTLRRCRRIDLYPIDAILTTATGHEVIVIAHGCIDDSPTAGLRRVDTVAKTLATLYGLAADAHAPMLVLTSHLPEPDSQPARLLARAGDHLGPALLDVIATTADFAGTLRLARILTTGPIADLNAPWRDRDRGRQLHLFTTTTATATAPRAES